METIWQITEIPQKLSDKHKNKYEVPPESVRLLIHPEVTSSNEKTAFLIQKLENDTVFKYSKMAENTIIKLQMLNIALTLD